MFSRLPIEAAVVVAGVAVVAYRLLLLSLSFGFSA